MELHVPCAELKVLQLCSGILFVKQRQSSVKMEVIIVYKGALAYYMIVRERADVYSAYLKQYNGPQRPAECLTLVRSIRHWTGSVDDEDLMYELGRVIDRHQSIDPLFPNRGDDRTIMDNVA
jgi:hypothetical protein